MPLIQLVYASTAVSSLSGAEVLSILLKSQANNHALRISGLLLYQDGHFLQLLEGEEKKVMDLFERISKDPRHTDVSIVARFEVPQVSLPSWAMAYCSPSVPDEERLKNHFVLTKDDAHELCEAMPIQLGSLFWEGLNGIFPDSGKRPPQ